MYFENDIHLAPIVDGAGVKNKVLIPYLLGITVLTTEEGANGLEPKSNLVVTAIEDFRTKLDDILENTRIYKGQIQLDYERKMQDEQRVIIDAINKII